MKTFLLWLFGALIVGFGLILAVGASWDVSGERSAGFPKQIVEALTNGHAVDFDEMAPQMQTVCIVPEYSSSHTYLTERGVSEPPGFWVGELRTLVVLTAANGSVEYFGLGSAQTVSLYSMNAGCGSAAGMVWEPVRTMTLGDTVLPIYEQTGGTNLY